MSARPGTRESALRACYAAIRRCAERAGASTDGAAAGEWAQAAATLGRTAAGLELLAPGPAPGARVAVVGERGA